MTDHLKSATIKKIVQSKLNKFFASYIKGTEGWVYAAQSKWQPIDIFGRLIQACCENSSIEDECDDFSGCSADTVQYRINPLEFDQIVHQINSFIREIANIFVCEQRRDEIIFRFIVISRIGVFYLFRSKQISFLTLFFI